MLTADQKQLQVERLVNLIDPNANVFLNMTQDEAAERIQSGDPTRVREIDGQFAILHKEGRKVFLARSIGRPMRYFLAKRSEGPCLVVAERMDEIRGFLQREGLGEQFHPSYTRMVPAHYVVTLDLVGCPDPNPIYIRYFTPERNTLPSDLDQIGRTYIGALATECDRWLNTIDDDEPIGVLFSGGIDSGAVFLTIYHLLLRRSQAPTRLKAFTLTTTEGGEDADQAYRFLDRLGLSMFLELIEADPADLDYTKAIRTIEDYKPLDVQSATMAVALCRGIRRQYPSWTWLVDGDGGDENLKDYPIEENPELTIRSVLNNLMLYQEGWGVDAIKHSQTYSGGQSRGHVRTYAPARAEGFAGFSPFALPNVIEVAEAIPFIELTDWDHNRLYNLKGEVVARGIAAHFGIEMPIFPKRRFQHGVVDGSKTVSLFPSDPSDYRNYFNNTCV